MRFECVFLATAKGYNKVTDREKQVPDKTITYCFTGSTKVESDPHILVSSQWLSLFSTRYNLSYFCLSHLFPYLTYPYVQTDLAYCIYTCGCGLHPGQFASLSPNLNVFRMGKKLQKCRHEKKFKLHIKRPRQKMKLGVLTSG